MKPVKIVLILVPVLAFILACNAFSNPPEIPFLPTDEPPGVGEKAEMGYAISAPVIEALEKYKADHRSYPENLADLAPDYLPSIPTKTDELEFSYSSTGDGYRFSFHYRGPGMNTCTYASEAKDWQCSGAY